MNRKILIIILIIISILIILLSSLFFIFIKTNKKDVSLIGSWSYADIPDYIYTFNEDKTGNYTYSSTVLNFTYEDNGTELSILYDGNTQPGVFKYRIENNKLIIKDSFDEDVEYVRK